MFIVVVVFPACPTARSTLELLLATAQDFAERLKCKVLPDGPLATATRATVVLSPPTKAHPSRFWFGSSGNFGSSSLGASRLHILLEPEYLLQDRWIDWFARLWEASAPLVPAVTRIPALVLPRGEDEAGRLWEEYTRLFDRDIANQSHSAEQEPSEGNEAQELDGESTRRICDELEIRAPDPLTERIVALFKMGRLITVDKTSRVPPLTVPVSTRWLGIEAVRTFGSATRQINVKIDLLDPAAARTIDDQRSVSKILQKFSFPLADGSRWVPKKAEALLEQEMSRINSTVIEKIRELVGSDSIRFAAGLRTRIKDALNGVYKEFHLEGIVGDDAIQAVVASAAERMNKALAGRFLPLISFNGVSFDPYYESAHASPWPQARNLLIAVAQYFRKAVSNRFFFLGVETSEDDLLSAMDVCGDWVVQDPWRPGTKVRAKAELKQLEEILTTDHDPHQQCRLILELIDGDQRILPVRHGDAR